MNVKQAQRALEIACLEALLLDTQGLTVSLFTDGAGFELKFSAEDVRAAAMRQLEALKGPQSIGEQVRRYGPSQPLGFGE